MPQLLHIDSEDFELEVEKARQRIEQKQRSKAEKKKEVAYP